MLKVVKSFVFVLSVLLFVGCATKVVNTIAHLEPVPSKSEVMASFNEKELAQAQSLYENNCAQCHKLKDPNSRDPEQWNTVLKRMLPKTQLTYDESKLVRAYLIVNSK